ncbi:P2X purinoceptor 5 isoform X2 [Tenrec ecaudatus]|uniref:P2X purinoceptor 5 isoform X2 n=1 Tax=Tenrec ecaudatus TaxID=94439 RepID=UPI003F5A05A6
MGQGGWKGLVLPLFDYKTEKFVIAKNKKVGLLYRLLQLSTVLYLVVWVFLVKKGYQDTDTSLQSSVITKVKGVAFTNTSELGERLWDVADYVIPPQGESAFFVVTNLIVTPNQRQDTCAENKDIPNAECSEDSDCQAGEAAVTGNGVMTGRCLRVGAAQKGTCEIYAWCPVEVRSQPTKLLLDEAEKFTVYIKNFIRFPKFNFSKTNVLNTQNTSFLKTCKFDLSNLYCPIFQLGSIVHWAGSSFQEMALKGGVIGIQIEWNCDLDKAASECNPHYSFSRLDSKNAKQSVSSGYNFRFAKYYRDANGVEFRTLMKAYGIRFDVMVNGKGAFFCDLVLIYIIKKSRFYRCKKYEEEGQELSLQRMEPEGQLLELPEAHDRICSLKGDSCVCLQPPEVQPSKERKGECGAAAESAYSGDVGAAAEPAYSGDLGAAAEPAYSGDVGAAAEPAYSGDVGATAEPAYSGDVGAAAEPAYSRGVEAAAEPAYSGDLGAVAEPAYSGDVGAVAEPAYSGDLGAAAEPAYSGDVGAAAEPAYSGDLGAAAEPAYSGDLGAAAEPAYSGDVRAAAEPANSGDVRAAAEPANSGDVGAAAEPAYSGGVATGAG